MFLIKENVISVIEFTDQTLTVYSVPDSMNNLDAKC